MGPVPALDAAHTKSYGRHLFHRRDDHDSGLRRYPAEVSLETLGTLIAITGVLMFGCSTAFLFVILQDVWTHHFY